jgi:hypothetical protein
MLQHYIARTYLNIFYLEEEIKRREEERKEKDRRGESLQDTDWKAQQVSFSDACFLYDISYPRDRTKNA